MTGEVPEHLSALTPTAPEPGGDEPGDEPGDERGDERMDERAGERAAVVTAGDRLDASAHAHLLEEPLPPGAATETAIIYNVTLAAPHHGDASAPAPQADPTPRPATVQRRSAVDRTDDDGSSAERSDGGTELGTSPPTGASPATGALASRPVHDRVGDPGPAGPRVSTARKVGAVTAVALVAALAGLSGYLWISATEWRDRAGTYQRTAGDLGDDLATTRNQLAGSQAELEAVRAQLSTAHARIVELADEKNQALDDWELTQQLVDYQQRISEAAGNVALALDQCVQGQQELIGYLEQQAQPGPSTPPYDPAQLAAFETEVEALCQEASEANIGLQLALAR